jgi:hypothetical protein
MDVTPIKANAEALVKEMEWLAVVIDTRIKLYFSQDSSYSNIHDVPLPEFEKNSSVYADITSNHQMTFEERVILALALAPHIQPHLLDIFFIKNSTYDRGFTEIGGIKGQNHGGFIPTGETAAFIIDDAAPGKFLTPTVIVTSGTIVALVIGLTVSEPVKFTSGITRRISMYLSPSSISISADCM